MRAQRPDAESIRVTYRDKNADDAYAYIVSFHSRVIPDIDLGEAGSFGVYQSNLLIARPSPDHVFVLRGFELSSSNGDEHVQRLAVLEADGVLTVAFEYGQRFLAVSSE